MQNALRVVQVQERARGFLILGEALFDHLVNKYRARMCGKNIKKGSRQGSDGGDGFAHSAIPKLGVGQSFWETRLRLDD